MAQSSEHPFAVCLKILKGFGKAGEYVWENSKSVGEHARRLEYLYRAISWLKKRALEGNMWRELPVDFQTFMESPHLLNAKGKLWPEVMKCAIELNSGKYIESVLTGGIGVGKTLLAVYTQAFQLYQLACMRDAHATFEQDDISEIVIVIQSKNAKLAKDVDYERFRAAIDRSPFFKKNFPFEKERQLEMRFPRRIIVKPVSGEDTAALGQNVIGGIIDEMNFMAIVEVSKQNNDGSSYDQAVQNYNSLTTRRRSRFMTLGNIPGMLCLVSSRNHKGSFTDMKEVEARTNPQIYVYAKKVWEIKPSKYSGEMFSVFIGDESRRPRILEEGEEIDETDASLVMEVPVEEQREFERDILRALRDIGGVSTLAVNPFIMNTEAVAGCFGRVLPIVSQEATDFGRQRIEIYPKRIVNLEYPRFAHIDLALSKDSAGVSIAHVPGFITMNRGDHTETLPIVHFDLILEVRPPRGGEIEFENIRKLLYTLRDKCGMPIKWVSFDQFQSRDSMQILRQHGFAVDYQSMDTTLDPYEMLKSTFYDNRVVAPAHVKAQHELVTLEIDTQKNKVDHPPNSSKDVADSMAGACYGISTRRAVWLQHKVPLIQIPQSMRKQEPEKKVA